MHHHACRRGRGRHHGLVKPGSWRPAGRPVAESAAPTEPGRAGCADPSPTRTCVPTRSPPGVGGEPDVRVFGSWSKSQLAVAGPDANVARPGKSRQRTEPQTTHLKGTT